ncbi:MBL fold metallo-hydrolase [Alkalihalobacterium chitinilyticum]|uniref:MBL fold metallo-hydrolase n=1 Tax=Alkalihalobacterium chitinilyticum TaxID=2980103 RepID=A0ABT5VD99_9BACI|nr:MBL fold metallo-hydrolase [Alkalihalobacterium chitinilyticum]MDE5413421.1 MBL fold metallo-hydrolase [Alkalihalobacterium chitinilyticum]
MTQKSMQSAQVFEYILNKKQLFILDVRNNEDYTDWKIEGEKITSVNIPYFDFLDGVDQHLDQLPKDQDILVVCAKEGSSKFVAEQLEEEGLRTFYLAGGMRSWSEYLYEAKVYEDEKIKVYQLIRVGKGCLSYYVISGDKMLIVDPLRFVDLYEAAAKRHHVEIAHIVDSHLHADHLSGGYELSQKTGAQYYIMKSEGAVFEFNPLENYEKIEFEDAVVEVLAIKTPGHTPGSVSFFVNKKLLFSGDTIFVSGLGRPDLGGKVKEWADDLYHTVYDKVAQIADDVIVLPAHYADYETERNADNYIGQTLGKVREQNKTMFDTDKEDFISQVEKSASSVKPPNFEEIISINRGVETADQERKQELEIGPNRCAVHHTS